MRSVFISYHHSNDQKYKDALIHLNDVCKIFSDVSVNTREIDEDLPSETIRRKIRDEYLRDSEVLILLVGVETRFRKYVDWELYSSMFDGTVNKRAGIVVINLPPINCNKCHVAHIGEKELIYPDLTNWVTLSARAEFENWYPHMPARVIDNLVINDRAKISVTSWDRVTNDVSKLSFLIEAAAQSRVTCEYDLSREMRRANGSI